VQRCLYGVDRNELAAELGKLSLWLATLARDHEFSFLDHCIRHGDSLVGLDRRQIEALAWAPQSSEARLDLLQFLVRDRLAEVEREDSFPNRGFFAIRSPAAMVGFGASRAVPAAGPKGPLWL
jgi:hypothetical protein